MRHSILFRTALLIGLGVAAAGALSPEPPRATSADERSSTSATTMAPEPTVPLTEPYPRGRWRLADTNELAHVVLWVSQILIRHDGVTAGRVSFARREWAAAPPPPARSRRAAFEMARDIEQRLRSRPEEFDEFARAASEDVATRERGGSMGGISSVRLRPWPEVLDALASIREGELSRVVETEFGFHIFLRRPPSPEQRVSGARIIIVHDDSRWIGSIPGDRRTTKRSRVAARELAGVIYEKAKALPEEFTRLVQQYSEHRDVLRDGDFGEWSTREPTPDAAAIEVLASLEVGQVAAPIDSLFGYQIILRTPNRPRGDYAMRSIEVTFDPTLPDAHERSRVSARRRADTILHDVRADPSRFTAYHEHYCCAEVEQWSEGRGRAPVERVLRELEEGQVAAQLVELETRYLIVQRTTPRQRVPAPTRFELPHPEHADMHHVVSHWQGLTHLPAVREDALPLLDLDAARAGQFARLHSAERLALELASTPDWSVYLDVQRQTRELLGDQQYDVYLDVLHRHFEDYLLLSEPAHGQ
jgi:hypothetical protein